MTNLNLARTTDKITSENYPYGFALRTTKTDYLEFSKKFGFRHCSQTVNPKTGRLNNPKKSTYYSIMVLGTDDNGHCKSFVLDYYGNEGKDKTIAFFSDVKNWDLFTAEQMQFIYTDFAVHLRADIQARCIYSGANFEDLKPLYENQISLVVQGIKDPQINFFNQISFDWIAIEKCSIEGYNPFTIREYKLV